MNRRYKFGERKPVLVRQPKFHTTEIRRLVSYFTEREQVLLMERKSVTDPEEVMVIDERLDELARALIYFTTNFTHVDELKQRQDG